MSDEVENFEEGEIYEQDEHYQTSENNLDDYDDFNKEDFNYSLYFVSKSVEKNLLVKVDAVEGPPTGKVIVELVVGNGGKARFLLDSG